jgi:hypothetical protein
MAEFELTKDDIKRMVNAITTLTRQVADVNATCQNLQMEIKHLKEQFRSSTNSSFPLFIPSYHELLCSGQLVTKLKLHQLVECANYKIQDNPEFSGKGGCAIAADYAYTWISTCFPLMNPQIIRDAIIIRPYGEDPLAFNDGNRNSATQTQSVVPGMKMAMWTGRNKPLSCNWTTKHDPIWECLTTLPETLRTGALHTVVLVTTEEGHRVCLDLSIGQFLEKELFGVILYYHDTGISDRWSITALSQSPL